MDPRLRLSLASARLDSASYYELLGVPRGADHKQLQRAFHRFALAYHPDRHRCEDDAVVAIATTIFERGVEAYSVLRNLKAAQLYQQRLDQGCLRLSPADFDRVMVQHTAASGPRPAASSKKPRQQVSDSLAAQMTTAEGKQVAERIELLLTQHRLREAYLQMGLLEVIEPDNKAVRRKAELVRRALQRQNG